MHALMLAGGFSVRLGALTQKIPKALVQIHHVELIRKASDEILSLSQEKILDQVALISNHKYFHVFETWLPTYDKNKTIQLIDNGVSNPDERLGAVGDLLYSIAQLQWNEDILVVSCDTISSISLRDMISSFHQHKTVLNAVYDCQDKEIVRNKLGAVILGGEKHDTIIDFEEKPKEPRSTIVSIPYYIFPKETVPLIQQYVAEGNSTDAPGSLISWLITRTTVRAFPTLGYYYDVGTPEAIEKLQKDTIFSS